MIKVANSQAEGGKMNTYSTTILADLGYGDLTTEGSTVTLTDAEVHELANAVDGMVEEIETARI